MRRPPILVLSSWTTIWAKSAVDRSEDFEALIEKLVAHPAVEGLDVAVLHRAGRCDVMPIHSMILRPAQHRVRGELGAIVGNYHLRLAARANEHRQLACNPFARDRGVGNCRQTYARHIIDNVEDAEAPALGELVMDEVERPARVDLALAPDRLRFGRHEGRAFDAVD